MSSLLHRLLSLLPSRRQRECILRLLTEGDALGMELVSASDGLLSRGSVYVVLDRMEEEGLIVSSPIAERERFYGERIPRRVYRITEKGRASTVAQAGRGVEHA